MPVVIFPSVRNPGSFPKLSPRGTSSTETRICLESEALDFSSSLFSLLCFGWSSKSDWHVIFFFLISSSCNSITLVGSYLISFCLTPPKLSLDAMNSKKLPENLFFSFGSYLYLSLKVSKKTAWGQWEGSVDKSAMSVAKPDDLSLILETNMVGDNWLILIVFLIST